MVSPRLALVSFVSEPPIYLNLFYLETAPSFDELPISEVQL